MEAFGCNPNRLEFLDAKITAATTPAGCVSFSRICSVANHSRSLRQSSRTSSEPQTARKKTACGICGRWHRSYYDTRLQVVRDLSCGDAIIYLELEVRRVDC